MFYIFYGFFRPGDGGDHDARLESSLAKRGWTQERGEPEVIKNSSVSYKLYMKVGMLWEAAQGID